LLFVVIKKPFLLTNHFTKYVVSLKGAPMEKHIKMVANSAFRYFAHVKQNPSAKQEQDDHHKYSVVLQELCQASLCFPC
jgi:hypothetical protein